MTGLLELSEEHIFWIFRTELCQGTTDGDAEMLRAIWDWLCEQNELDGNDVEGLVIQWMKTFEWDKYNESERPLTHTVTIKR